MARVLLVACLALAGGVAAQNRFFAVGGYANGSTVDTMEFANATGSYVFRDAALNPPASMTYSWGAFLGGALRRMPPHSQTDRRWKAIESPVLS